MTPTTNEPLVTNAKVLGALDRVREAVAGTQQARGQLQHALVALFQIAKHEQVPLTAKEVSALTGAERSYCSRVWRACAAAAKAGADIGAEMEPGAAAFIDKWLPTQARRVTKKSAGHQKLLAKIKEATRSAKRSRIPAKEYPAIAAAVMTLFEALQTEEEVMAPEQVAARALIERAHHFVTGISPTVQ